MSELILSSSKPSFRFFLRTYWTTPPMTTMIIRGRDIIRANLAANVQSFEAAMQRPELHFLERQFESYEHSTLLQREELDLFEVEQVTLLLQKPSKHVRF